MHKDFAKDTNHNVHYETFWKYNQKKNISFAKQVLLIVINVLPLRNMDTDFLIMTLSVNMHITNETYLKKEQSKK